MISGTDEASMFRAWTAMNERRIIPKNVPAGMINAAIPVS
jgi:hypothetical protein